MSYTWGKTGKSAAKYNIHLPGDKVIKVRQNLRNARRFLRDKEASCWLWIEAICINQGSNGERNHQVKLMADIYGEANVVMAWLGTPGESAGVGKAFKFIHDAVTDSDSEHTVYHYCKAHSDKNEANWRAVRNVCRLRYWTRKWIIQELVAARTVVLQAGTLQCPMADLETFYLELYQNRNNRAYKTSGITDRKTWAEINQSPAARLASQGSDAREAREQRLLYQLVRRYASSEFHLPCDHVYALYSLVERHREYLAIDYAASPVARLVAVLAFVRAYEPIPPSEVLEFANLLVALFKISQEELLGERTLQERLDLVISVTQFGRVQLQPESDVSIGLRRMAKPLHVTPSMSIDSSANIWVLTRDQDLNDQ